MVKRQAVRMEKIKGGKFPLWLSQLRIPHNVHEDAGLIPGLPQWAKDLALLRLQM